MPKGYKYYCEVEGCGNVEYHARRCRRHTEKIPCGVSGCKNQTSANLKLCVLHRQPRACSLDDCETLVMTFRTKFCEEHRAKVTAEARAKAMATDRARRRRASEMCVVSGCSRLRVVRGRCVSHSSVLCRVEGCQTKAASNRLLCSRHRRPPCSEEGCSNMSVSRGLCRRHNRLASLSERAPPLRGARRGPVRAAGGIRLGHRPFLAGRAHLESVFCRAAMIGSLPDDHRASVRWGWRLIRRSGGRGTIFHAAEAGTGRKVPQIWVRTGW